MVLRPLGGSGYGPVDLDATQIEVASNNVTSVFGDLDKQVNLCATISPCADVVRISARMQRITDNQIEQSFEQWIPLTVETRAGERFYSGKILGPMHPGKYLFSVRYNRDVNDYAPIGSVVVEVPEDKNPEEIAISLNSVCNGDTVVRDAPRKVIYETDQEQNVREDKVRAKRKMEII